jgi:integrase
MAANGTKLKGRFNSKTIAKDVIFNGTVTDKRVSTQKTYSNAVIHYCNYLDKSPTEFINEAISLEKIDARTSKMTIKGYLGGYKKYISTLAPKTVQLYTTRILSFYKKNDIQIPDFTIEDAATLVNSRDTPSVEIVRNILADCELKHKCIILLQCSSGMGLAELLSITREDFEEGYDVETGVTTFHPLRRKTTIKYTTFCTPECSKYIKLWLEDCDRRGRVLNNLVGMSDIGVKCMYGRLSENAGYKKTKSFRKIRSHAMRKLFTIEMNKHGLSFDVISFLSGRKPSRIWDAYNYYTDDKLKKEYMQHMEAVTFIDRMVVYTDERVQALEKQLAERDMKDAERDALIEQIQKRLGLFETVEESDMSDEKKDSYKKVIREQSKRDLGKKYDALWLPDELRD